jgi:hypothetical protein
MSTTTGRSVTIGVARTEATPTFASTPELVDMELDAIALPLGVTRGTEDADSFASTLHHRIDDLIREHAQAIMSLMETHDRIARLVP